MAEFALLLERLLRSGSLEPTLRRSHLPCRRLVSFDDFFQDVVLRGLRHGDSFRGQTEAELAGWLRAIANQQMIDALRRSHRDRPAPLLDDLLDRRGASPPEQAERRERLAWLARALATLDDDDRDLLLRHYYQGESFSDIARARGVKPNTLIQRHLRLLERLRTLS